MNHSLWVMHFKKTCFALQANWRFIWIVFYFILRGLDQFQKKYKKNCHTLHKIQEDMISSKFCLKNNVCNTSAVPLLLNTCVCLWISWIYWISLLSVEDENFHIALKLMTESASWRPKMITAWSHCPLLKSGQWLLCMSSLPASK